MNKEILGRSGVERLWARVKALVNSIRAEDIGAVATSKVLTTVAQINANTDTENVAGATAVRDMISRLENGPDDAPNEFSELFDGGKCDIVDITFKKRGKNHTAPYNWTTTDDISSTSSQEVFLSTTNDNKIFGDGIGLISGCLDIYVDFGNEEVTISESADFGTYDYIAVLSLTGFFSNYTAYIPVVFWISGIENDAPTLYSDALEPDFNSNCVTFHSNYENSETLAVALAVRR